MMDNSIEQIWCSLKYGCEPILLGCIYRQPKCTKTDKLTRSFNRAKELIDKKSLTGILLYLNITDKNQNMTENTVVQMETTLFS